MPHAISQTHSFFYPHRESSQRKFVRTFSDRNRNFPIQLLKETRINFPIESAHYIFRFFFQWSCPYTGELVRLCKHALLIIIFTTLILLLFVRFYLSLLSDLNSRSSSHLLAISYCAYLFDQGRSFAKY